MFHASRAAALLIASLIGGGAAAPRALAATRDFMPPPVAVQPPAGSRGASVQGAISPASAATGSIKGTVASSSDAVPLGRARITLSSPALSEPRVVLSRADGTYEFIRLPAGAYSVSATRSGYAPQAQPGGRSGRAAALTLQEGQSLGGINFALLPAGVIAGRIMDEDGKPFEGAVMDALVPRTEAGQPTLVSAATAESDDRGEFRLTGLPSGQYYVSAFDPAFARVGDETGPLRYTATYYPGVASPEQATRVAVTPGAEPAPVTFGLKIVRPARVSGRINTPDRRPLLSAAVMMARVDSRVSIPADDASVLPDGTFTFRNVPPGGYEIKARGELVPGGITHFAMVRVLIEGRDIADVQVELLPGASVSGMLVFEAGRNTKRPPSGELRVRAPLVDGRSFADAVTGEVRPDGTYAIRGVMPGSHVLTVDGLRYPWVVKSVISRGQDITDAGIEADARQRFDNVRITVTDGASELSGRVLDEHGMTVPDAMVLVIPLAQQFWHRASRRFGLLRTDAAGRFTVRGLPEGEYRVVAPLDLDESEVFRAAVLEQLSDAGAPLSLKNLEQRVLDVSTTAATRIRRASAR
jgi:carboxypeptidase family protein